MNALNLSLHSYVKSASPPCTRALWQNKMTSPCSQNSTQVCDYVLCFCSFIPLNYALLVITRQSGSHQAATFCTVLQSERLVSLVPVDSPSFSSKLPEANCRQYSDTYSILTRRQFKHGIGTLHSGYTVVSRGTLRKFK